MDKSDLKAFLEDEITTEEFEGMLNESRGDSRKVTGLKRIQRILDARKKVKSARSAGIKPGSGGHSVRSIPRRTPWAK